MKISHIMLLVLILGLFFAPFVMAAPSCSMTCRTIGNITTCDQVCTDPNDYKNNTDINNRWKELNKELDSE